MSNHTQCTMVCPQLVCKEPTSPIACGISQDSLRRKFGAQGSNQGIWIPRFSVDGTHFVRSTFHVAAPIPAGNSTSVPAYCSPQRKRRFLQGLHFCFSVSSEERKALHKKRTNTAGPTLQFPIFDTSIDKYLLAVLETVSFSPCFCSPRPARVVNQNFRRSWPSGGWRTPTLLSLYKAQRSEPALDELH